MPHIQKPHNEALHVELDLEQLEQVGGGNSSFPMMAEAARPEEGAGQAVPPPIPNQGI